MCPGEPMTRQEARILRTSAQTRPKTRSGTPGEARSLSIWSKTKSTAIWLRQIAEKLTFSEFLAISRSEIANRAEGAIS